MVPSHNAFNYVLEENKEETMITKNPDRPTIGIKIGDGKTAFKELPLLTDVSSIRPDWHETDPSSPNYIWHKPVTNSDLFITTGVETLIFTDKELKEALENDEGVKIYHAEEYCFLKDLNSGNYFNHPEDLLIEEDNTWGHYDIIYNKSEINHEPRYFYRNNILSQIDSLKRVQDNSSYQYKLEKLLDELILSVLIKNSDFVNLFTKYIKTVYSKEDIVSDVNLTDEDRNNINLLKQELELLSERTKEQLNQLNSNDQDYDAQVSYIKEQYAEESTKIYNQIAFIESKNYNYLYQYKKQIENNNSDETLYHISYWILRQSIGSQPILEEIKYYQFDMIKNYIWLISNSIADYLVTHEGQFEHQIIYNICKEQFKEDNIHLDLIRKFSGVIYESMRKGDNINNIEKSILESIYTYYEINNELLIDSQTNQLYMKKSRLSHFYEQAHGVIETYVKMEPYETSVNIPFEIKDDFVFGQDYIVKVVAESSAVSYNFPAGTKEFDYPKGIKGFAEGTNANPEEEIKYLTINLKTNSDEKNKIINKDSLNEKNGIIKEDVFPSDFNVLPEEIVKVYYKKTIDPWKEVIPNSRTAPIKELYIPSNIDIVNDIDKLTVTVQYVDDTNLNIEKVLRYLHDFDITTIVDSNNTKKTVVQLFEPLNIPNCIINYNLDYPEVEIKHSLLLPDRKVIFDEKSYITDPGLIIYKKIGIDHEVKNEKYADENTLFTYSLEKVNNDYKIILNKEINLPFTINIVKSQNVKLTKDNIDLENNKVNFNVNISVPFTIYFVRNSLSDGDLQIHIPFRKRRIKTSYISEFRGDWNTNEPNEPSYILNRPFYKRNDGLVVMLNEYGEEQVIEESRGYYEYICNLMRIIINDEIDDDSVAGLEIDVSALKAWQELTEKYIQKLKNYTNPKKDKNGNPYGGPNTGNDSDSGVLKALDQLVDGVAELEQITSEIVDLIHIGKDKPQSKYCKIWINTKEENGHGLLFFFHPIEKIWKPISALWSPPDSSENIS